MPDDDTWDRIEGDTNKFSDNTTDASEAQRRGAPRKIVDVGDARECVYQVGARSIDDLRFPRRYMSAAAEMGVGQEGRLNESCTVPRGLGDAARIIEQECALTRTRRGLDEATQSTRAPSGFAGVRRQAQATQNAALTEVRSLTS